MDDSFAEILSGAVALLRVLPRDRKSLDKARASFRLFRDSLNGIHCDLLADHPPASDKVDYDILIGTPDGGTVVVSWQPDEGVPLTVQHADHWAANYVLTVNERHTSIQSALVYLNTFLHRRPHLMEELINGSLILQEIEASPPEVSEAEIKKAINDYRIGMGLSSAAATREWLAAMGLTAAGLRELVEPGLKARKLKERLTADQVRPWFRSHRSLFEMLTVFRVHTKSKALAAALARGARRSDLWTAVRTVASQLPKPEGRLTTMHACEFPESLAGASERAIAGPESEPGGHWVGQLIKRAPARLDRATRMKIQDTLFRTWLAERRQQSSIRWHWM